MLYFIFLLDLYFEYKVYPVKIYIYETYNPGAIVRIWAYDGQTKWNVLWESHPVIEQPISRIFSPKIKTPNFPTK
jgi:F-box/leucine-rich repeat protein 4